MGRDQGNHIHCTFIFRFFVKQLYLIHRWDQTSTTITGQNGSRSNGNKEVTPYSTGSRTGASTSDVV